MAIKHKHTAVSNEIIESAFWNDDHEGTAPPENHGNAAHTSVFITGAEVPANETDPVYGAWIAGPPNVSEFTNDAGYLVAEADPVFTAWDKDHADLSNILPDQHHLQSHTLASHSTKTHAELTNVTSNQHHAQSHNAASHSDITSTGAQIDDAVSKKHTQGTDTTLGNMTAAINMNTHKINNVVDPALNQDAATKKYVDDNIAIPTGTYYWSCSGSNFKPILPATHDYTLNVTTDAYQSLNAGSDLSGKVFLPHGAVVTGVIADGNPEGVDTFILHRVNRNTAATSVMATAAIGTEDNTITNPTIDNNTYVYFLEIHDRDAGEDLYGARITYTL